MHKNVVCSDETWMLNKPGKSFMQPWKSLCHEWRATDSTHNCMPGCEIVIAVAASWCISVCRFCLSGIRSRKSYVWRCLGMNEFFNLPQRCWVGRAGPIPWPGWLCDFTLLDIFWNDVTDHIYIPPFGIVLMEGNTETEHILRPTPFLDCMQHKLVIAFWRLGITIRSHFQGSRCQRRTCLDSRQPAQTWCLLEKLTVTELIEWQLIFRGDVDLSRS